jgi:hypothetical protein
MGQLIQSIRPATAEVRFFVQRPPFQVRGSLSCIYITIHNINFGYMLAMLCLKKYISPLQVKKKPHDEESEHVFILSSMDCTVWLPTAVSIIHAVSAFPAVSAVVLATD